MLDTIKIFTTPGSHRISAEQATYRSVGTTHKYCRILREGNPRIYTTMKGLLYVSAHLPSWLGESNLYELQDHLYEDVEQSLLTLLRESGIELLHPNLDSWKLSAVHFCVNISVDEEVYKYLSELSRFTRRRGNKEHYKSDKGEESLSFFSNGKRLVLYDKITQMKDTDRANLIPQDLRTENLLRIEYQLTKKRAVDNYFGYCPTLRALYNRNRAYKILLDEINAHFRNGSSLVYGNDNGLMELANEISSGRGPFDVFAILKCGGQLVRRHGGLDSFTRNFLSRYLSPDQIRRVRGILEQCQGHSPTSAIRVSEIRRKIRDKMETASE